MAAASGLHQFFFSKDQKQETKDVAPLPTYSALETGPRGLGTVFHTLVTKNMDPVWEKKHLFIHTPNFVVEATAVRSQFLAVRSSVVESSSSWVREPHNPTTRPHPMIDPRNPHDPTTRHHPRIDPRVEHQTETSSEGGRRSHGRVHMYALRST